MIGLQPNAGQDWGRPKFRHARTLSTANIFSFTESLQYDGDDEYKDDASFLLESLQEYEELERTPQSDLPPDGIIIARSKPKPKRKKKQVVKQFIARTKLVFSEYIVNDFWSNFTIVSIPAIFTNFIWRFMNLYGIAVSHDVWTVLWLTSLEIASVIFIVCFIIDGLRQIFINRRYLEILETQKRILMETAFLVGQSPEIPIAIVGNKLWIAAKGYWMSDGMLSSFHLGVKFYLGCVLWTLGYEMIAKQHQIYAAQIDRKSTYNRSAAAGVGSAFGLLLAGQLIIFIEYYVINIKGVAAGIRACWFTTNQRGIFGVALKGFWEGFVWALIGDARLYVVFQDGYGLSYNASAFLDSIILGLLSSIAFSVSGIFLSVCGYFIDKKRMKINYSRLTADDVSDSQYNVVVEETQPLNKYSVRKYSEKDKEVPHSDVLELEHFLKDDDKV